MQLIESPITKKERKMIFSVEILDVGYKDWKGIIRIFLSQKEGYYKYYLYIYIFIYTKFYYLSFMDLKGSNLSWFPLKEPIGCLMGVEAHT